MRGMRRCRYRPAWVVRDARHVAAPERSEPTISRFDADVHDVHRRHQHHFGKRTEQAIRNWQAHDLVDPAIDPVFAADALGAWSPVWRRCGWGRGYPTQTFG